MICDCVADFLLQARLTPVVSALTWVQHPGDGWYGFPGSRFGSGDFCDLELCEAANPMGISTRLIFTYPHFALCWLCG